MVKLKITHLKCEITNKSDEYSLLALQGTQSLRFGKTN